MQISLRSQMIAGTTALVGATAIAMTPMAPAVSLPSINTTKAAVELAAFNNPILSLVQTGGVALNYLINSNYSVAVPGGGATNWGTNIAGVANIGDAINIAIRNNYIAPPGPGYLPQITSVGIVPNFLAAPFPIGIQVLNNWVGYAGIALNTGATVLGNLSALLWAPVGVTVAIANAILTGNIANIPTIIQTAVQTAIDGVTGSVQAVVTGVQQILGSVVAKASALVNNLSAALPALVGTIQNQVTALTGAVTANLNNVTTALASGNIETIWNAAVNSLLGPTGIPGAILNISLGAGLSTNPLAPATSGAYAPSVRATIQTLQQSVKGALGTAPASASAVRSAAAAKTAAAPAAAAAASSHESAASGDAAPAPAKAAAASGRRGAR